MRLEGKTKLGFYPLPASEARHLKRFLSFTQPFSALDPCTGDGRAFAEILEGTDSTRYGIEIDAYRVEQAREAGIEVLHADTLDVRCSAESFSLIYLNPPYDFEAGVANNQRLEVVFLEHVYRWLKAGGILLFVISQQYLRSCARLLAEYFTQIRIYKLTHTDCMIYEQVALFAVRRKRGEHLSDTQLGELKRSLEDMAGRADIPPLPEEADASYVVPPSEAAVLTNAGIPLDEVEDQLLSSSAYRQIGRLLLREQNQVKGRPLTPLHGGHVGLLCTAGMLNGVFGDGEDRHLAHWRSLKFVDHWEEDDEDGTKILHDRERFSHELTLIFADGRTRILTHKKEEA